MAQNGTVSMWLHFLVSQYSLGRDDVTERLAGLLSASEKLDGGAQFEFRAASEKANFVWIGCTSEALKTVSNSTQCLLSWVN